MCAIQMTGNDRDGGSGDDHAQARFEGGDFAGAGSRAFGKKNEPAGFLDEAGAEFFDGVAAAIVSPHG